MIHKMVNLYKRKNQKEIIKLIKNPNKYKQSIA